MTQSPRPQFSLTLEKAQKISMVVWCAITATVVFLGAAALAIADGSGMASSPERDKFLSIFPMIAAIQLAGSALGYRLIRYGVHAKLSRMGSVPQSESDHRRYMGFFASMAGCCALHETVAVLGFVLTLISKNLSDSVPYVAAALLANGIVFPSRRRIERF